MSKYRFVVKVYCNIQNNNLLYLGEVIAHKSSITSLATNQYSVFTAST